MSRIITIKWIAFLLWQLMYINFTNAQADILHGMIKDGENEIHLTWRKTEQLLANEHLPVWTASNHPTSHHIGRDDVDHKLHHNIMKKHIGEFIFYHDKEKLSAIVYFKKTNTLHGYIDTKYLITDLPITESNIGHSVGGPYVTKLTLNMNVHDHLRPLDFSNQIDKIRDTDNSCQPSTSYNAESSSESQRVDDNQDNTQVTTFYPEILLFVPYDVKQIAVTASRDHYLVSIIKHFLLYFNSIDMLFSKLSTDNIKIHINLAGIVVEDEPNVFSFMKYVAGASSLGFHHVDSHSTMRSISHYLNANRNTFPQDSFDYYFISTNYNVWIPTSNRFAAGISTSADIFQARQTPIPNESLLGVMVHYGATCGYTVASHEIAHLMSIGSDPPKQGYYDAQMQCYAIMQESSKFCSYCLKWSAKSTDDLKRFASSNRNRCFLLNKPRSLNPHGHTMTTLWPSDQCRCYGFDPRTPINTPLRWMFVSPSSCNEDLVCGNQPHQRLQLLPLDGTPCGANKVCWNRVCRFVQNRP